MSEQNLPFIRKFHFKTENSYTVDLSKAVLSPSLIEPIFSAICSIGGGYKRHSLMNLMYGVRILLKVLGEDSRLRKGKILPYDSLERIREAVGKSDLHWRSKNMILHRCAAVLTWIHRNRNGSIAQNAILQVESFLDDGAKGRKKTHHSDEVMRRIMRACEEDIDKYWERFEQGQKLLEGKAKNKEEKQLATLLKKLTAIGNGLIPKQLDISANSLADQVWKAGGIEHLRTYIHLTAESFLPFYLHITAQLAGNSVSVFNISRECIISHEILQHSEMVTWAKGRSIHQSRAFDIRKKNAAPNLLRKLLMMTEPLVKHTPPQDANKIFLHCRGDTGSKQLSWATVHKRLATFIEEKGLPNFDPVDLRPSVGDLHAQIGGIHAAKKILNQKKVSTTERYLNRERVEEAQDKLIHKFQGVLASSAAELKKSLKESKGADGRRVTTFGFDCKDPLAGIAPGSRKGEKCNQFKNCSECTGAIVVLDDPLIIARLLQAHAHLEKWRAIANGQGWGKRFSSIYQDTFDIIDIELLPLVPVHTRPVARSMVKSLPPLPDLE